MDNKSEEGEESVDTSTNSPMTDISVPSEPPSTESQNEKNNDEAVPEAPAPVETPPVVAPESSEPEKPEEPQIAVCPGPEPVASNSVKESENEKNNDSVAPNPKQTVQKKKIKKSESEKALKEKRLKKKRRKSQKLDESNAKKKKVAESAKPKRKSQRKKNKEAVEVAENDEPQFNVSKSNFTRTDAAAKMNRRFTTSFHRYFNFDFILSNISGSSQYKMKRCIVSEAPIPDFFMSAVLDEEKSPLQFDTEMVSLYQGSQKLLKLIINTTTPNLPNDKLLKLIWKDETDEKNLTCKVVRSEKLEPFILIEEDSLSSPEKVLERIEKITRTEVVRRIELLLDDGLGFTKIRPARQMDIFSLHPATESDTPQDDAPQPNIWEWEILPEGEEEFVVFKQIIWSENHHKIYEGIIARAEKERLYPAKKQFKKYHYAARKKFEKLVPADIAKTYDEVAKEYKHTGIEYENMKPQITFAHKPTRSLLSIFHLLLYEASPSESEMLKEKFNAILSKQMERLGINWANHFNRERKYERKHALTRMAVASEASFKIRPKRQNKKKK